MTVVVVTHDPEVSGQVERTVAIRDGRTSSEVLRRTAVNADGDTHVIAEEYAVMDRAGPGPGAPRLPPGARADPAGPAGPGGRPRGHPPR